MKRAGKSLKKQAYIVLGCIGVAVGAIGTVIPLLPSVPFFLLAVFCFARSSQTLHNWFVGTKLYKENLESYMEGRGMPVYAKVRIMISVTILMTVGFIMMQRVLLGQIILVCIWVLHILYFTFGVKNAKNGEK